MIRVRAPSRLHFGLLSWPTADTWEGLDGTAAIPSRRFGGAGLMVERPGLELTAEPAHCWQAEGPLADRVLAFVERFRGAAGGVTIPPQSIHVLSAPPEHAGLGTGTQLGMAVGRLLERASGVEPSGSEALAVRVGRGLRSSLGLHGFAHGGFLVEAGKRDAERSAPLVARLPFPENWRVVLVVPPRSGGLHGVPEREAFCQLEGEQVASGVTDTLCRIVLLGMMPALIEHDFETFAEAVHDYNARVGELFAPVQGGRYATPAVASLVRFLRSRGVRGVGQSSWGPTVFALAESDEQAEELREVLHVVRAIPEDEILVTRAWKGDPALRAGPAW